MKGDGFSAANFLFLVMLFQQAITKGSSGNLIILVTTRDHDH